VLVVHGVQRTPASGLPTVVDPSGEDPRSTPRDLVAPDVTPPPVVIPATPGGRRADVFDPNATPNAPGAPRPLGSPDSASHPPIGAPDGRMAGAPLDLSTSGGGSDRTLAQLPRQPLRR
jgi:hypothetical protein